MKGTSRANQYRKIKKLNVAKAHEFEACNEKDMITMLEKADVSQNQLLKLLISAISNAWKIYNAILVCNLKSSLKNKGIADAGSTADLRMLWSAIVCLGLGLL